MPPRRLLPLAILAILAGLAAAQTASAALVTRAMLIRACTAQAQVQLNDCAGYVAGIADMVDSVRDGVCIPEGIKFGILRKNVVVWLQGHTTSNGPAAPTVVSALRGLYPCTHR
jgi:hypothetical protein